ncbi:hypothetical protein J437_LFUL011539 [Ladona fulva]|uniref:Thyroglobulin type-1 domain-containing protein n=1 Tax=Ladona fulva TaxID=123851 RepID=A0A8K0K8W1_LADFU|nr:hypothetical protein J437_LFUL011539 [Ladona fulva]
MSESNSVIVSSLCEPGLICDKVCIVDEGTCFSYNHQDQLLTRPSCDPDGGFAAVQCKGDFINGRCFCYDKGGHRIFGQDWWKDTTNMTCACSREVSSILSQGDRTDVSLHCSSNGNYEEMQCDDSLCWCADSTTGLPLAEVVPETMISMLPCADKIEENTQYLRQCESISISVNRIKDISKKHGTIFSSAAMDKCDADGSYGAVQIIERQAHCSKKDKIALGSFQAPINEMNEMDCNCARDGDLYEQNDLLFFMDCAGNGDYKAMQAADGKHFCVDSDGYPTTEMGDITECPVFPHNYKMVNDIGLRNSI